MTSGVEIALISGGWTALVGMAGFGAAILTTNKTIKSARYDKLRGWRAEVYVDLLAAVKQRQDERLVEVQTELPLEFEVAATGPEPDWDRLEARALAFASQPVLKALLHASAADDESRGPYRIWLAERTEKAKVAAIKARQAADDTDRKLAELIRAELQGGRSSPVPVLLRVPGPIAADQ